MYFGSVRFFKHLIVAAIFAVSLAVFFLLFYIVEMLLLSSGMIGDPAEPVLPISAGEDVRGALSAEPLGTPDGEGDPGIVPASDEPNDAADAGSEAASGDTPIVALTEEQNHDPGTAAGETDAPALSPVSAGGAPPGPPAEPDPDKPYQLLYPDLYRLKPENAAMEKNTVYLTFDDGPSALTPQILDILRDNGVKATFFVVGRSDETSREIMRRIVREGHAIGVHSYTHDYPKVYASLEAYLDDFQRMEQLVFEATEVRTDIFRFPGGSVNSYNRAICREIIDEMNRRGFTYYDWNVSAMDTVAGATQESIRNDVLSEIPKHARSIVLFHDSGGKTETVKALDAIIKELKERGYSLESLSSAVKPIIFRD